MGCSEHDQDAQHNAMLLHLTFVCSCSPVSPSIVCNHCKPAGPPNPAAAHLDGHLGMDASPPFLRVQHNEPDPDTWFQHSEPPALGIADYFEHEHGMM